MKLAVLARNAASAIARSLPQFRGLGSLCNRINAVTLRLGAPSLATAKMKDGTTILLDLTTRTEKLAFYTGRYDDFLLSTIQGIFDPNGCFLDVGANIGFYTVSVASFCRSKNGTGRVVAFEPFEPNYRRLENNVARNDLHELCLLRNIGLSDELRMSEITLREDFSEGSETGNAAIPTNDEFDEGFARVPIELKTLDNVWADQEFHQPHIDMIKVDIEGHEDFFLRGAQATVDSQRPTILMEVNKPYYRARGVELNPLFRPLMPHDYSLFRQQNNRWVLFSSFDECREIDNVFLIPNEKRDLSPYRRFAT